MTPLAFERLAAFITQRVLAERAGIHREHLAKIERGECHPTPRTAQKIADALECSIEEIFPSYTSGPAPHRPNPTRTADITGRREE
jgi:transcriptional regulator with XRE-family HTH domain